MTVSPRKRLAAIIQVGLAALFTIWGGVYYMKIHSECTFGDFIHPELCVGNDPYLPAYLVVFIGISFWYLTLRTLFWKKSSPDAVRILMTVAAAFLLGFLVFEIAVVVAVVSGAVPFYGHGNQWPVQLVLKPLLWMLR